jgi:hypothetical protein
MMRQRRRRAKHVGTRLPGRHVAEKRAAFSWLDEDGSFGAAVVVAGCLGVSIGSVFAGALLN